MKNDKFIEAYKKVIGESFTPEQPAKLVAVLYEAEEGGPWTETDRRDFTSDRKVRELMRWAASAWRESRSQLDDETVRQLEIDLVDVEAADLPVEGPQAGSDREMTSQADFSDKQALQEAASWIDAISPQLLGLDEAASPYFKWQVPTKYDPDSGEWIDTVYYKLAFHAE